MDLEVWLVGFLGHVAVRKASMMGRLYVWVSWVCGWRAILAFFLYGRHLWYDTDAAWNF